MNENNLKDELNILDNNNLYVLLNDFFIYGQTRIYDFTEVLENINVKDYIEEED